MKRLLAAFAATGLALAAPPAHADPTVAQCVDSFENAQRAQKNGHLVFAKKLFQECLVPACPKAVRDDCTQGQASVDRGIATVTVVVRDAAGADVPSTIKVDGNPLVTKAGLAAPIDPGPHQFQYTVGEQSRTASITINEGEKSRLIVLPATGGAPTSGAAPTSSSPPGETTSEGSPSILGPALLGGAGALLLLAAGGAYLMARGEASERDDQAAIYADTSKLQAERTAAAQSSNSHSEAADNDTRLAIILGASGLALLGGAAAWYFLTRPNAKLPALSQLSPVIRF